MLGKRVAVIDYTTGDKLDIERPEELRDRIGKLIRANQARKESLMAGDVQLIGLSEIRDWVGDGWNSVKRSIHKLVEEAIEPELEDGDVYFLADDERYMLVFAQLNAEQSEKKARKIAETVLAALAKVQAPPGTVLTTRVRVVPVETSDSLIDAAQGSVVETVGKEIESSEEKVLDQFEETKSSLKPLYWPATNIPKGLISFYRGEIVQEGKAPVGSSSAVTAEMDKFGLMQLGEDLGKRKGLRTKALALLSCHYETLAERAARTDFLDSADLIPPDVRKRIALEIIGMPVEVSQARLNQIFTEMSPFFRGFVCRLPTSFSDIGRFEGIKLLGISTDGSLLGKNRPRKAQFKVYKRFADLAHGRSIRTFFIGAQSVEAAIAARRAEFDYVDGTGVLQPMPLPGRVYTVK